MFKFSKNLIASFSNGSNNSTKESFDGVQPTPSGDEVHIAYEPGTGLFDLKDPFPWDERDSLVIYAVRSDVSTVNPDKSTPSIIIHHAEKIEGIGLLADGVPYLTEETSKDMNEMLVKQIQKLPSPSAPGGLILLEVQRWVQQKTKEGFTYFLYSMEPKDYAGNCYPWAIYAERNRSK